MEKTIYLQESKRQYEEDQFDPILTAFDFAFCSSRYGKLLQELGNPPLPLLGNRFQILSLVGKGGFSVVYKVNRV